MTNNFLRPCETPGTIEPVSDPISASCRQARDLTNLDILKESLRKDRTLIPVTEVSSPTLSYADCVVLQFALVQLQVRSASAVIQSRVDACHDHSSMRRLVAIVS